MGTVTRAAVGVIVGLATVGVVAACGKTGSTGSTTAADGCAPMAGRQLVMLADDKKLQSAENVIPAINAKAANDTVKAALDKVSAAVGPAQLLQLNKMTNVQRMAPSAAAAAFATSVRLAQDVAKGPGGKIVIGTQNTNEYQNIGELYKIALTAAGYDASVRQVGDRTSYLPALEKGDIQVVPEPTSTLTEYLNQKLNGPSAAPAASGDLAKTVDTLESLGAKVGLAFAKPAGGADQNAFAITKATADRYGVATLSDFAAKCSGGDTVLGGPASCPQEQFCQRGLETTYGLTVGKFETLDTGGPKTLDALRKGKISIGLVFSSDTAFAAG